MTSSVLPSQSVPQANVYVAEAAPDPRIGTSMFIGLNSWEQGQPEHVNASKKIFDCWLNERKELSLIGENVASFPYCIFHLKSVETLDLTGNPRLNALPDFSALGALKELRIDSELINKIGGSLALPPQCKLLVDGKTHSPSRHIEPEISTQHELPRLPMGSQAYLDIFEKQPSVSTAPSIAPSSKQSFYTANETDSDSDVSSIWNDAFAINDRDSDFDTNSILDVDFAIPAVSNPATVKESDKPVLREETKVTEKSLPEPKDNISEIERKSTSERLNKPLPAPPLPSKTNDSDKTNTVEIPSYHLEYQRLGAAKAERKLAQANEKLAKDALRAGYRARSKTTSEKHPDLIHGPEKEFKGSDAIGRAWRIGGSVAGMTELTRQMNKKRIKLSSAANKFFSTNGKAAPPLPPRPVQPQRPLPTRPSDVTNHSSLSPQLKDLRSVDLSNKPLPTPPTINPAQPRVDLEQSKAFSQEDIPAEAGIKQQEVQESPKQELEKPAEPRTLGLRLEQNQIDDFKREFVFHESIEDCDASYFEAIKLDAQMTNNPLLVIDLNDKNLECFTIEKNKQENLVRLPHITDEVILNGIKIAVDNALKSTPKIAVYWKEDGVHQLVKEMRSKEVPGDRKNPVESRASTNARSSDQEQDVENVDFEPVVELTPEVANARVARLTNVNFNTGLIEHMYNSCYLASLIHLIASNDQLADLFDEEKHTIEVEPGLLPISDPRVESAQRGQRIQKQSGMKEAIATLRSPNGVVSETDIETMLKFLAEENLLVAPAGGGEIYKSTQDTSEILQKLFTYLNPGDEYKLSMISSVRANNGYASQKIEKHPLLQLEIDGLATIEDALRNFSILESVEDLEVAWDNNAKPTEKADGTRQITFNRLPNILPIALKRFENKWDDASNSHIPKKINTEVSIPEVLTIPAECLGGGELEGKAVKYKLIHFTHHSGGYGGGHYVAFAKNIEDKWYKHDDTGIKGPENSVPTENDFKKARDSATTYIYKRIYDF